MSGRSSTECASFKTPIDQGFGTMKRQAGSLTAAWLIFACTAAFTSAQDVAPKLAEIRARETENPLLVKPYLQLGHAPAWETGTRVACGRRRRRRRLGSRVPARDRDALASRQFTDRTACRCGGHRTSPGLSYRFDRLATRRNVWLPDQSGQPCDHFGRCPRPQAARPAAEIRCLRRLRCGDRRRKGHTRIELTCPGRTSS